MRENPSLVPPDLDEQAYLEACFVYAFCAGVSFAALQFRDTIAKEIPRVKTQAD